MIERKPLKPRTARLSLTVVLAVVTLAMLAHDIRTYTFRWRSTLEHPPHARHCPDLAELAARTSLPDVDEQAHVVPHFLDYACDAQAFLRTLVGEITRTARTDLERAMQWVTYVQTTIWSSLHPPLDADGIAVYHPIWLLEHQGMHCGQNARLVVDGLTAVGIPARVLQMHGHVSAEFFADGKWRFAEADILSNGEFVLDDEGTPASVDEILERPELLASVHPYSELTEDVDPLRPIFHSVFERVTYPQSPLTTPYVIRKTAPTGPPNRLTLLRWLHRTLEHESALLTRHSYGWNHYEFCSRSDRACTN